MMYVPQSPVYGLSALHGDSIVLQSVEVDVAFNDLLSETVITQTYHNPEKDPIEAVYTFPLASQVVLLDLAVTIGDRQLRGRVVKKSTAEKQYEEAVIQGDAAIMLEQAKPGLYAMNVGNILAGEQVVVTIRSAELQTWNENTLRFSLPTTIAPRYGDPEQAGLHLHHIPETDLLAEHRFQLNLTLTGFLALAQIECPSHQVAITPGTTKTTVKLASGDACMDRDFILTMHLPQAPPDTLQIDQDFDDGWVALASFIPQLPAPQLLPPKSIKIVMDCSGSMAGDSMTQARQAIGDILSLLRPDDYFNLILFGSSHRQLFDRQVQATGENITKARRQLRSIEADMGGAEMQAALLATVEISGPSMPQDILLITAGEIWQGEELISLMRRKAHRVFAVGVGSAVAEGVLCRLAQETGGACELVSPNEGMAPRIVRHFQRILLPRVSSVTLRWPGTPLQVIPKELGPVFHGDTLHVFARFSERPTGAVALDLVLEDGGSLTHTTSVESQPFHEAVALPSTLARMAIARSLTEQKEHAAKLAVRYQLTSTLTNYVVCDNQDIAQISLLPPLRKVPQMLAAGWGGTGSVVNESSLPYESTAASQPADSGIRYSVAPSAEQLYKWRQQRTPSSFIYHCNRRHTRWFRPVLEITSYADLDACELPERILEAIASIAGKIAPTPPEQDVILAFLYALMQSPAGGLLDHTTRRTINKYLKKGSVDAQLLELMRAAFAEIGERGWGPSYPLPEELEETYDLID